MGVRLYPSGPSVVVDTTETRTSEEFLAEVPAGTAEALNEFDGTRPDPFGDPDALGVWYKELEKDEHLANLSHFRTFGWGKFDALTAEFVKGRGFNLTAGQSSDPEFIEMVLIYIGKDHLAKGVKFLNWN